MSVVCIAQIRRFDGALPDCRQSRHAPYYEEPIGLAASS
jgi:hypothetical protein